MSFVLPVPTPQDPDGLDPDVVERLSREAPLNVLWMLGRTGWVEAILTVLSEMFDADQFPPQDRETMILRIASATGVEYPVLQHRLFARNAGMSDEQVQAIIDNDLRVLDPWTGTLCRICDEITENVVIRRSSLEKLVEHYGRNEATRAIWMMSWFNMWVRFVGSTRLPLEQDLGELARRSGPSGEA